MGVRLSAGTLDAVFSRLESQGLIEPLASEDRRRPYHITPAGAQVLSEQAVRMQRVAAVASDRLRTSIGCGGA